MITREDGKQVRAIEGALKMRIERVKLDGYGAFDDDAMRSVPARGGRGGSGGGRGGGNRGGNRGGSGRPGGQSQGGRGGGGRRGGSAPRSGQNRSTNND